MLVLPVSARCYEMNWPDLKFPPVNLWSLPYQLRFDIGNKID